MKNFVSTGLKSRFTLGCILTLFFIIGGCDSADQSTTYNVVLVTFDTTRADHIGVYGKENAHTPNLDALASDGVMYKKALTPIPITLPSHSTMMTGKVPFTHGVRDNGLFILDDDQLTLAEILNDNDYVTGASIGSFPLTKQFGIDQGFDYYNQYITQQFEDVFGERTIAKKRLFFDERTSTQVNQGMLPWIKENHEKPFFAWLHYFDPHHPHEPPTPYNQMFTHDLYQGEIAYADESFGHVISTLKDLGVYDNTMIVFTSDHGEGNGEHNETTHSLLVYNTTQHVPLIIKYPNQLAAGTVINQWVGLVDILPTVLDFLGLDIPEGIQGQVLTTENQSSDNEYYLETLSPRFSRGWGEQRAIVKNQYKYIHGPLQELYNLKLDPNEINNLIETESTLAASMKQDLEDYIDEFQVVGYNSSVNVDSDTMNTLRGLGYIQSTGDAVETFEEKLSEAGDPPQWHVDTNSVFSHAKHLLFSGDYIQGSLYLESLLQDDPENIAYLEMKVQAEIKSGNLENAKNALEKLPENEFGTFSKVTKNILMGQIHLTLGNQLEALDYFNQAESAEKSLSGQLSLAQIYALRNQPGLQIEHLNAALELDPGSAKIKNELAVLYSKQGDFDQAEIMFNDVIDGHPYHHLSYYNYGVMLIAMVDYDSSIKLFKRSIELKPQHLESHYALIETLFTINDSSSAVEALDNFAKIAPKSQQYKKAKQLLNITP